MPDWSQPIRDRLATLRLDPAREAEIVEEMAQHLEERYEELRARGASEDEAVRAALEDLSEPDATARHMGPLRQAWAPQPIQPGAPTGSFPGDVGQDLRHALRTFSKQSAFAAAVVLTLGLGIGTTTAMFTVIHGVLLRPLAFPESDRIVALFHDGMLASQPTVMNHGPATYFAYRDNQETFTDLGAWDRTDVAITGAGEPERVPALAVTDGFLPVLGVTPRLGRFFRAEDDLPGRPPTVVLSHGYWLRRFGGAEDVVGRSVSVDGETATIIGVLPPEFRFPRAPADVLLPLRLDRADAGAVSFGFQVIGRLLPDVTLEQASADVARMIPILEQLAPSAASFRLKPNLYPLIGYAAGDIGGTLWILFGTAGIVLLIACANVANLFLVRAEGRHHELALRTVLGAGRGRLARALLIESLVLALAGGVLGIVVAAAGTGLLRRIAPATLPRVEDIQLDAQVLLFALGVSVLASVLLALLPVSRLSTPGSAALKEGGRGSSDGPSRLRVRNVFAVVQVAMAFVLLIVSGLMVRTSLALRQVPPGFTEPETVQTLRIDVPEAFWDDPAQMVRIHQQIGERLAAVPGVQSVGIASSVTMDGEDNSNPFLVESEQPCAPSCYRFRRFKTVAPGHFTTVGNPLVAGRDITWEDIYEMRRVLLVSAPLAREIWGDAQAALGQRIEPYGDDRPWYEVIGVVGDERDDGLDRPATGILYWPLLNDFSFVESMLVYSLRSDRVGDASFLRDVRDAVWSVDPDLPISGVLTLAEIRAQSMASTSFALVMLGIAAAVALLLAIVGVYGVIAYVAVQRTREVGIRLALGAEVGSVRAMFLRYGLGLTGAGILLGIGGAALLTRILSALLYGVSPTDVTTYGVVSVVLIAAALVATSLPVRRASRVDPVIALRGEG
ncbi:MAG: ADOP family duplicated permease [Gemmatimonadales bacterium]